MARRVLTGEKLEKELERLSLMREFERQYEDLFPRLVFQITFSQGSSADMDNHSKASYDHRDPDQRHPVTQTVSRSSFVPSVPVFSHDSSLPS